MYLRWAGVIFLSVGIAICSLSFKSYRKGEKWSWYTLLTIGILPLVATSSFDYIMGDMTAVTMSLIAWILIIIALILPIKTIFTKK
jgi:hypothetical protein